jgi:protein-L-isoaspartate(D-aspartate) O-methyltransferase
MSDQDKEKDERAADHDPFAEPRRRMVQRQLRGRDIDDPRVLDAMSRVAREQFLPHDLHDQAYADAALPIESGQTISQPYTVAFMCQALQLQGQEKVLEVGTGSGYGAAVLSLLAREVHTVERFPELAEPARDRLRRLGYTNVQVHVANGTLGLPEQAPWDAVIATAAAESLPSPYERQLAEGGRIVLPLGSRHHSQFMYRFTRRQGRLHRENLGAFVFVPLIGQHGFQN